jgi:hypothetical protein
LVQLLAGNQVAVGPAMAKLKQNFVKTSHSALLSKLVMNKRLSLYGLMPKMSPIPPAPAPSNVEEEEEVEEVVHLETPRTKIEIHRHNKIFCCFTGTELPEPELSILVYVNSFAPPFPFSDFIFFCCLNLKASQNVGPSFHFHFSCTF